MRACLILLIPLLVDVSSSPDRSALFLMHTKHEGRIVTRLVCVDLARRKVRFQRDTRDTFEVRIARRGGVLFFPHGLKGEVDCLNARTGRVLWTSPTPPFRVLAAQGPNRFLVAGRTTHITSLERRGDQTVTLWSTRLEDEPRNLLVSDTRIVVPTYRTVVCLDARTGRILWKHAPRGGACYYAALWGKRVVAWDWWGGRLEMISVETGQVTWTRKLANPWLFGTAGGKLLVGSGHSGVVRGIDGATGQVRWQTDRLCPQIMIPRTADLAYMPFVGPALKGSRTWFVTKDQRGAFLIDPDSGRLKGSRQFDANVVGAAPARHSTCFATRDELIFTTSGGTWRLALDAPVFFLRGVRDR